MKINNIEVYGIIYKITNLINGKVYIGQTVQKFNRRYRHGIISTHNKHLKRAIEKYGIENFEVIENFDIAFSKEELNIKEIVYIDLFKSTNPLFGYNLKSGGDNGIPNEETRKKMCENNKGEKNPMYGKCKELHWNYGGHASEETREKISKKLKGKTSHRKGKKDIYSQETIEKMSESGKGIKNSNAVLYKVINIEGNEFIYCGNQIYNHHSIGFLNINAKTFEKYILPFEKVDLENIPNGKRYEKIRESISLYNGWKIIKIEE